MPKQVIINMEDNYPFGECEQCNTENTRVLVRKIYEVSLQERNKLMEKVGILRRLKNQNMIKIQSVLQQEDSIHFLFQYIPIKLETWISNINDQFIQNFRDQLIKFSSFLANNGIKIYFQLKNIGMDQNYGAKYFLDLNFEIDANANRQKLKSTYIREISNLFKPYIMNTSAPPSGPDSERERNSSDFKSNKQLPKSNQSIRKQHDSSISPPTNKASNKHKEKALEKYYQQVNMSVDSENDKILQEFMDVLDGEGEEELAKNAPAHNTPPANKPQTQFYLQPNQFQKQNNSYQQTNTYQQPPVYQQPTYQQAPPYTQPPPKKQQSPSQQPSPSYQQEQYQQPNKFQLNSPQQSNQYQPNQNEYIQSNQNQQNSDYYPKPNSMVFKTQGQIQNRPIVSSQSMGRGRSQVKQPSQMWRESADLQNRVKNAIQKSMNVIKKFKAIKDSSLI